MKCPHCGNEINIGVLLGSVTTKTKARAARRNGKLGGWPKGRKRGPRKRQDENETAFRVIREATQQGESPVD